MESTFFIRAHLSYVISVSIVEANAVICFAFFVFYSVSAMFGYICGQRRDRPSAVLTPGAFDALYLCLHCQRNIVSALCIVLRTSSSLSSGAQAPSVFECASEWQYVDAFFQQIPHNPRFFVKPWRTKPRPAFQLKITVSSVVYRSKMHTSVSVRHLVTRETLYFEGKKILTCRH